MVIKMIIFCFLKPEEVCKARQLNKEIKKALLENLKYFEENKVVLKKYNLVQLDSLYDFVGAFTMGLLY